MLAPILLPVGSHCRDVIIHFCFKGDANRHICELQLAHEALLRARKMVSGYAIFCRMRNASELQLRTRVSSEKRQIQNVCDAP